MSNDMLHLQQKPLESLVDNEICERITLDFLKDINNQRKK